MAAGVIKGNGYDGRKITIRQLLNHTSGLASYTDSNMRDITLPQNPFRYYTVDELISLALAKPPVFAPGGMELFQHQYSTSRSNYSEGNRRYVCGADQEKIHRTARADRDIRDG